MLRGEPRHQVTDYRSDLAKVVGLFRVAPSWPHEPDHLWPLLWPVLPARKGD